MPPKGKLPPAEIAVLTKWVKMGAPWSPKVKFAVKGGGHEKKPEPQVNAKTKKYWAFQPVKLPALPRVKNDKWGTNTIDKFILARLEKAGLQPSSAAGRTELLRRAYYDLIGLPPSPKEVQEFLADKSPDAYEKVLDKLLASPHYGEKWGRHWLDLVRYAESNSYERDNPKPHVWRYRDYVIRAFNEDKPYTQFIREQIAGDELDVVTRDSIIATGYYRLGIWGRRTRRSQAGPVRRPRRHLMTTSQTFLGLTMNCARCHNHKISPIPQKDYYRFLAFFSGLNRFRHSRRQHDQAVLHPTDPCEGHPQPQGKGSPQPQDRRQRKEDPGDRRLRAEVPLQRRKAGLQVRSQPRRHSPQTPEGLRPKETEGLPRPAWMNARNSCASTHPAGTKRSA